MKTINKYINESLKKIRISDLQKCLDKIAKWNKADNIMKLMSEYMSAGDAEDLDKSHWDACVEAVAETIHAFNIYIESYADGDSIDLDDFTDWYYDTLVDSADELLDELNDMDKDCDWESEEIFNLFNTISQKLCRRELL